MRRGLGVPKVKEAPTPMWRVPWWSQSEGGPRALVAGPRWSQSEGGPRALVAGGGGGHAHDLHPTSVLPHQRTINSPREEFVS